MRKWWLIASLVLGVHPGFAQAQAPAQAATTKAISAIAAQTAFGDTRALLVWQKGQLVAEHYGQGYTAENKFVSWSMAKTITAIALGMLIDEGRIALDDPAPIAAWRTATDGHEKITTRHLLGMTSGLKHQEGGEGPDPIERADTVRMLFSDGAQDAAAYATARPLAHPPGTRWQYSTATTHILAEMISNVVAPEATPTERRRKMAEWFNTRLWQPLGITSAEWDFDAKGLFLGGSMVHMTARDYGRLGQFLLDKGVSPSGARLISEQSMALLLTKAKADNNNHYAGHLWLNTGPSAGQPRVLFHPRGGTDTFSLVGHLGQYVIVVPSKQMVIVRLGKSNRAERDSMLDAIGALIEQQN